MRQGMFTREYKILSGDQVNPPGTGKTCTRRSSTAGDWSPRLTCAAGVRVVVVVLQTRVAVGRRVAGLAAALPRHGVARCRRRASGAARARHAPGRHVAPPPLSRVVTVSHAWSRRHSLTAPLLVTRTSHRWQVRPEYLGLHWHCPVASSHVSAVTDPTSSHWHAARGSTVIAYSNQPDKTESAHSRLQRPLSGSP